jgi:regulator of nonsense transcripts 1
MSLTSYTAVDNVLERFVEINSRENLLPEAQILRVATDISKVNPNMQHFTVDARVGGDLDENNRLAKRARERVQTAILVFTTCAGAGLGTLRNAEFDISIVDEASQCTEPTTLIPLVKGCSRAILVGDHVQLRPIVHRMGQALQYDRSLLERLYTSPNQRGITRRMLEVSG